MKTPKLGFIPEKYMHMRDFHVKKPNQTKPKTHKTKNPIKNQINKQTKKRCELCFHGKGVRDAPQGPQSQQVTQSISDAFSRNGID